ncbi:MAG: hypothetical protein ACJ79R_08820 [Anaeromyxobacteraceae bacterium]
MSALGPEHAEDGAVRFVVAGERLERRQQRQLGQQRRFERHRRLERQPELALG